MPKSTHKATCQACGNVQAVVNGKMAKHGYTVEHGFFAGTCPGSDEVPMETSTDLTMNIVKRMTTRALALMARTIGDIGNVAVPVHKGEENVYINANTFQQLAENKLHAMHREGKHLQAYAKDLEALAEVRYNEEMFAIEGLATTKEAKQKKAAVKRDLKEKLEAVKDQYHDLRKARMTEILEQRNTGALEAQEANAMYWSIPQDLHQIRTKHTVALGSYADTIFRLHTKMVNLRDAIKAS